MNEHELQVIEYYALEVSVPAGDYGLQHADGYTEFYRVGEYGSVTNVTGDHVDACGPGFVHLTNEVEHPVPEGLDRELVLLRITDAMFNAACGGQQ